MNRTRKGGMWKLFRDNSKTFLNVTLGMIPDSVDEMLAGMGMVHFNMKFQFFFGGGEHAPRCQLYMGPKFYACVPMSHDKK